MGLKNSVESHDSLSGVTTGVIEQGPTPRVPAEPPIVAARRWEPWTLAGILVLAGVLYVWALGDRALQPYYAAAVRSMTESPRAFFFGGFDPAGVISIDKTPFAFWVQGVGVWVFGYHWWAIALVQAIEGVAAVFVLHRVVRRWAGERPALLAALVLALSPITVALGRSNQADFLMVLMLLLAAYAVTRAVERAPETGFGWLVLAGVFVGLAFFAKMLAGWIVLPALGLAYLVVPVRWPVKLLRLLVSGVVAAAVSLAWPLLVSLWPASDRPFVGSTTSNSVWDLIFGYNGFGRVSGGSIGSLGNVLGSFGSAFSGPPGPTRLFDADMGGQIGWLLPVALASVVGAAVVWFRTRGGTTVRRAGWLLWSGWLVIAGLVFSFAGGIFHRYYTVELAPAIAATAAVGLYTAWGWYRAGKQAGLLLPAAIVVTAAYAFYLLDQTPDWLPWLRYAVVIVGVLAVVALLVRRVAPRVALAAGLAAVLAGPLAYSVDTMLTPDTVFTQADPIAGPSTADTVATIGAALHADAAVQAFADFMAGAQTMTTGQQEVLSYVTAHAGGRRIQLAVELGSWGADPYLMNSSARVVAFGGYLGLDPAPTSTQLADWADNGQLGYVLFPDVLGNLAKGGGSGAGIDANALVGRVRWTGTHCRPVPPKLIGPAAAQAGILFDCAHQKR